MASSGTDGTIQIWDPERSATIGAPLTGHTATVYRLVAWTWSGGRILASAGESGEVYIWDLDSEAPQGRALTGHEGWVQALAFWKDASGNPRLASAGADGTVRIWDPLTGDELGPPLVAGRPRLVGLAAWSAVDGARLAVADDAGNIQVWLPDSRTSADHQRMQHDGGLWTPLTAWTAADGTPRLASGGLDGTIRIWNPESGAQVVEPLRGHTNWVPTLATWAEEGGRTRIVSASTDGTVRMWDAETGVPVGITFRGLGGSMATLTTWHTSSGELRLALVGGDGAIRSCNVHTGQTIGDPLVAHVAGVWALTNWRGSDGTRLARSGDDGTIRVWNADTGQEVGRPLIGHTAGVWALVSWTADGTVMLASTGDDGTIRVWNMASGARVGAPMTGHAGWVPGLASWSRPDGSTALVSAGVDGTVRRWNPAERTEIGDPLRAHDGAVMAVATWRSHGGPRLASGGVDGLVRLWDPDTGGPVGRPLTGHTGLIRAFAVWQEADRTLLVSGSYDQTIRIWDGETGAPLGEPLTGHHGAVATLTVWTAADGGARLASAGSDGVIRVWNLETRTAIGPPLAGHAAGVWALTSWSDPRFGVRLASAGHDGSVRLWDPELGHAVRTIEIGPVEIWGLSDAPTSRDVIGRQVLADAIADQLRQRAGEADPWQGDGPTVVSVEGPWGSGKSTMMNLVRERLPIPAPVVRPRVARPTTVRTVLRELRRYGSEPTAPDRPETDASTGTVTAWFNPWAYQSGEQVWAGLANEIIEAAADVLYPTEPARERYWLARNLGRVDRYALRRSLKQRTRSPILRLAIGALITPLAISLVRLNEPVTVFGTAATPVLLAAGVAVMTALAGAIHTLWRRWFGRAVDFLPTDLLTGPVADGSPVGVGDDGSDAALDPLRRARAGALYLYQHNIGDLIDDLAAAGYDLVVFVDDIDRCRPGTVAEVFEAINLFLSNVASRSGLRAHFVVGLDSAVVASHLDLAYGKQTDPTVALHGDDPTPGWAFLRKLIQLPVLVPEVPDEGLQRLVDSMTRAGTPAQVHSPLAQTVQTAAMKSVAGPRPAVRPAVTMAPPVPVPRAPVDIFTWRAAERHPEVRELLIKRLSGQPYRSIREAKRLINVWQFYERVMDVIEPPAQPDAVIARARHLLIVAEVVTRWPALQRALHRHIDDRRGLQLLAAAVDSDVGWQRAIQLLGVESPDELRALAGLRTLLRDNDGKAVADLAARLM